MFNFIKRYMVLIFIAFLVFIRLMNVCGWSLSDLLTCEQPVNNASRAFVWLPDQLGDKLDTYTYKFRETSAESVRKYVPSPHSELLLGLTLGINDISKVPTFNDVLLATGTIHVVVVSGYNISLVFSFVSGILGSQYKLKPLISALIFTLIYAVISGFEPPVIRAWVMGAVASLVKFHGRRVSVMDTLLFSALVMALINPLYLLSMSFQLSFLAAFGLVYYSDLFNPLGAFFNKTLGKVAFFSQDLVSTLAAQVLVWPLISYKFERVSLISPLVNSLLLWTTPLATVLGSVFVFIALFSGLLAKLFAYIVIVPLDIFVRGCYFFAKFPFALASYKPSLGFVAVYFVVALLVPHFLKPIYKKSLLPAKNVTA